MITGTALVFLTNVLTSIIKNYVIPKLGKAGTQIALFMVSFGVAGYMTYEYKIPGLKDFVWNTASLFSLAVAVYEVLLSRLPFFRKE